MNQGNIILKNETGGAWDNDEKKQNASQICAVSSAVFVI